MSFQKSRNILGLFLILSWSLQNCICVPPLFRPECYVASDCGSNNSWRCDEGFCISCGSGYCGWIGCNDGEQQTCVLPDRKGPCQYGVEMCANNQWLPCQVTVTAMPELCNNRDDNCDGSIDETFAEISTFCLLSDLDGPCARGEFRACVNGEKICEAVVFEEIEGPSQRNCNDGIDNDCDGFVDDFNQDGCIETSCKDGTVQKCYPEMTHGCLKVGKEYECKGVCSSGERICKGGKWPKCKGNIVPSEEICGNIVDENCNDRIDENCSPECFAGETEKCYEGPILTKNQGACKEGYRVCSERRQWGSCQEQTLPATERCFDGFDNDCNGAIDDCPKSECQVGEERACYTEEPSTRGIGVCRDGIEVCESTGTWSKCKDEKGPSEEVCEDQKDNDCDGLLDECAVSSQLLSGSWGKNKRMILWDMNSGKSLRTLKGGHVESPIYAVGYSEDGKYFASGGQDQQVIVRDAKSYTVLWKKKEHQKPVYALAFQPKGAVLATGSGDKSILLWNLTSGMKVGTLIGHKDSVFSLAIDKDGEQLASGGADESIYLWDLKKRSIIRDFRGHLGDVYSVAIHPRKKWLLSGGRDADARIWEMSTGKSIQVLSGHTGSITAVAFRPDGEMIALASADGSLSLWAFSEGKARLLKKIVVAGASPLYSLAFRPDSKELSCGAYDHLISVFRLPSGKLLKTLKGHAAPISGLSYPP